MLTTCTEANEMETQRTFRAAPPGAHELNFDGGLLQRGCWLLGEKGIDSEMCSFRLVAFGPILKDATRDTHRACRDSIAPMEKALADSMSGTGYHALNTVNCRV